MATGAVVAGSAGEDCSHPAAPAEAYSVVVLAAGAAGEVVAGSAGEDCSHPAALEAAGSAAGPGAG